MKAILVFIGCICLVLSVGVLVQNSTIETSILTPDTSSRIRSPTSSLQGSPRLNYAYHAPIEVSNDDELAAVAVSGDVTNTNPYVVCRP